MSIFTFLLFMCVGKMCDVKIHNETEKHKKVSKNCFPTGENSNQAQEHR